MPVITRRSCILGLLAAGVPAAASAGPATLDFEEIYGAVGVLGLTFSDKAQGLAGGAVTMRGFMAPPLKAEARFFVLTSIPTALCPFCSSDADWPDNIVVVYLHERQTFVQFNAPIQVNGTLEMGSWTDPDTGFVSLLRLREAEFRTV